MKAINFTGIDSTLNYTYRVFKLMALPISRFVNRADKSIEFSSINSMDVTDIFLISWFFVLVLILIFLQKLRFLSLTSVFISLLNYMTKAEIFLCSEKSLLAGR